MFDEDVLFVVNQLIEKVIEENEELSMSEEHSNENKKVLEDLEDLAEEVEQRLRAIENTERELDQWRDQQLEKNRYFWDEYRRQVENFSSCRIRTLQYEYTMKELKRQRFVQRLQKIKYLMENVDQFDEQCFSPSLIQLINSETFQKHFHFFFSTSSNEHNSSLTSEQWKDFEQFSSLDQMIFPGDDFIINDHIEDQLDQ